VAKDTKYRKDENGLVKGNQAQLFVSLFVNN
jgi:hypothetical protein